MPTDMRVALVAFLALLLGGCEPPKSPESKLALTACRLPGVETEARCATLDAWEDRASKTGRRIKVKVAVVPAKLRAKEPDPIVIFAGGPGQGAIALAPQVLPLFAMKTIRATSSSSTSAAPAAPIRWTAAATSPCRRCSRIPSRRSW